MSCCSYPGRSPANPPRHMPETRPSVRERGVKEYMIVPQTMFLVLSPHFEGITPCGADGRDSPESAANIRWLQGAAGLPVTGVLDRPTWNALFRLYEVYMVRETGGAPVFTGGWG